MKRLYYWGCFLSLLCFSTFRPIETWAQSEKYERYCALIYTNDDISDEVQRAIDDSQARGLGQDMLNAGLSAIKGIGAGYVTSFIDLGVSAIGSLITKPARDKQAWEEAIKKENSFSMTINTIAEISDFYDKISLDGPMDPTGMHFDGIGCIKKEGNDTSFFISCHINRDKINRIVEHSKFELVLDSLILSPFHSDLPNTKLNIPFSFDERENFTMTLIMSITSSWMDQLPQMNKDQHLGEFTITIPVRKEELDQNGYLRYARANADIPKYAVVGESFIVPRSYMSIKGRDGKVHHSWGTGEYKVSITLNETCEATKQLKEHWKKDYKRKKKLESKKSLWGNVVQFVTTQKWDELTKSWVVTTLKAPAGVLSQEIIKDLHLKTDAPNQGVQSQGANSQNNKK